MEGDQIGQPESRPELNESFVAWTVLKDLREANQRIATQADLLMRAIEKDPSIDKAMCITMGIRPKLPPQMGKPGFEVQPK
jgi:hypothetical protein